MAWRSTILTGREASRQGHAMPCGQGSGQLCRYSLEHHFEGSVRISSGAHARQRAQLCTFEQLVVSFILLISQEFFMYSGYQSFGGCILQVSSSQWIVSSHYSVAPIRGLFRFNQVTRQRRPKAYCIHIIHSYSLTTVDLFLFVITKFLIYVLSGYIRYIQVQNC